MRFSSRLRAESCFPRDGFFCVPRNLGRIMSEHPDLRRDTLDRRDFLHLGAAVVGLSSLPAGTLAAAPPEDQRSCILLVLTGGPSQLETWDPKPSAPVDIRGPFRSARTSVPGLHISEHLPRLASQAHHFALIRSLHHEAAPIHETGLQLLQTGRLAEPHCDYPHYGAVLSYLQGQRSAAIPPFVLLPRRLGPTGVAVSQGQGAGCLGLNQEPCVAATCRNPDTSRILQHAMQVTREPESLRERYGRTAFGTSCLRARRLVEAGVRLVTVNMFASLYQSVTWDCHAEPGCLPATLDDYRRVLCPMFDAACATLLQDLHERGLLKRTLVVALGEMGRAPAINHNGGRDHWTRCWSILLAGAGIRGGHVLGSSDRWAAEPHERPVAPAEVAATIYQALDVAPQTLLTTPTGQLLPVAAAEPIQELF